MKKRCYLILLISCFLFIIPIKVKGAYSCPDGYQLTADTCTKVEKARQRNGEYYCDPTAQKDAVLDEKTKQCVWTRKAEGTDDNDNNDDTLDCREGYIKTEGTCLKIVSSANYRDGQYYCTEAGTKLVGTSCVLYETTSEAEEIRNNDDSSDDNYNPGEDVYGCEVVPKEVHKWIRISLNFIKYIALVLVIVLGTIDFIKAAGSGEPDAMKKAGQTFIKRVIAVIILFLLPMIVELILHLINLYGANDDCFNVLN